MLQEYFVYVLRCGDGSLYTGYTANLEQRLKLHELGRGAKYTRSRLPVSLVAFVALPTRAEAMTLEVRIKRLSRKDKLSLIARSFQLVAQIARGATSIEGIDGRWHSDCGKRFSPEGVVDHT